MHRVSPHLLARPHVPREQTAPGPFFFPPPPPPSAPTKLQLPLIGQHSIACWLAPPGPEMGKLPGPGGTNTLKSPCLAAEGECRPRPGQHGHKLTAESRTNWLESEIRKHSVHSFVSLEKFAKANIRGEKLVHSHGGSQAVPSGGQTLIQPVEPALPDPTDCL